jgi:Domain of unknown function (DUF4340)
MNWRTTPLLLTLALVLFAFILMVERKQPVSSTSLQPPPRLLNFKPEDVTAVLLRRTNQLVLRADRTNSLWNLTLPLSYPARYYAIEGLLESLSRLDGRTYLSPEELKERNQNVAQFNLDIPLATLTLQQPQGRLEIMFGAKTTVGDRVYAQVVKSPGIYVIDSRPFDELPASPNDWRDTKLANLTGVSWDRFEVRLPNRTFALQFDPTNRNFYLSKPTPARADQAKVEALLRAAESGQVSEFLNDNPRADLEPYGLVTPAAEMVYGLGTNDLLVVQFGAGPTNNPAAVYARCLAHTNVVLTPKSLLEALQTSHSELREKRLLTLVPEQIDSIEVAGTTNFIVRRQPEAKWILAGPGQSGQSADPELVRYFMELLGRLEGNVERDVVTDWAAYGLAPPRWQYALKSVVTNAAGGGTNRILAQIEFGAAQEENIFVRRTDEQSVYTVPRIQFERLPHEPWQLRDRQVWSFSTNQIAKVTVRLPGKTVQFLRTGPAEWRLAPGTQGVINNLAVEETMYRLGNLRADFWTARGDENRARFGFDDSAYQIAVELKEGDANRVLSVEFGGEAPNQSTYALTTMEGQSVIFEFPKKLQFELVRDLMLPFMKRSSLPP